MAIGLVTDDGLIHQPLGVPRRLGNTDRAIFQFRSAIEYKIAPLSFEPGAVSEPVLAVGFPAGAEVGSFADHEFQRWYPPRDLSVESIPNRKSKILKPPHLSVGSPLKSKI
ncbi:hypothetical protein Q5691_09950 [Microcoleus sp. w1-18aA5]|uniref:hypothetical protein n=1 Tax=Microcoleus sp. w1-18aA5 TaxID=2818982 RepID=UPI002FCE9ED4